MRRILLQGLCFIMLWNLSCSEDALDAELNPETEIETGAQSLLSKEEINQTIEKSIRTTGDFNWNDASDQLLWSAVIQGNNILTVGYGNGEGDFSNKNTSTHQLARKELVQLVTGSEYEEGNQQKQESEDILIHDDEFLTVMDFKVTKLETIIALRKNSDLRYLEPAGYQYFQEGTTNKGGGSGCGLEGENLETADFTTISPNARMPWNFPLHRINNAWSFSTGRGITIGVVDTGISPNQSLLGSSFNNGFSSGRRVERFGTYINSPWPWSRKTDGPNDQCGHGTSMTAAATAPRNDRGLPVGVAYNANLISYRAAKNVVLDGYQEQRGVARAITALGNRADVKIISMSMGHIFSVNRIKDAIRFAHGRGKLIFCAGGTSTSFTNFVGVIFPASMSETVAVTGIEEGAGYDECDACHKGRKIDFTVIMERSNNNHIPVLGHANGASDYVGGSSVATATTAGIAALVWAKHPNWSRDDVLNKLKTSAELYPNRSRDYGWGNIDALKAVQ
ncbi:S8 family peptidase [Spongiimicrobium salis]|uniref:S8 family peptidase n=1 Tax=Spongiimicrobium salis TaxID=1667022 RepID=UPI00374D1573